jgi:hypothetical protein
MKTGPDALGTAENLSGSAKHEKCTRHPRTAETSSGAQNMKTGLDDSVRAMNRPRTRTRSTKKSQLEDTLNSQQDKGGDKLNSR